jgi:ArsR family transcriptional regulator, cadmium/lead-responsive transcriptional repressor
MSRSAAPAPFRLSSSPSESELLAKYFRAFADPTRLRILELLGDNEASVGQLVAALDLPQPKVSNHLACLRWCGFVASRREHRTVYYRVADERVSAVIQLAADLLRENADHVARCGRIDGGSDAASR